MDFNRSTVKRNVLLIITFGVILALVILVGIWNEESDKFEFAGFSVERDGEIIRIPEMPVRYNLRDKDEIIEGVLDQLKAGDILGQMRLSEVHRVSYYDDSLKRPGELTKLIFEGERNLSGTYNLSSPIFMFTPDSETKRTLPLFKIPLNSGTKGQVDVSKAELEPFVPSRSCGEVNLLIDELIASYPVYQSSGSEVKIIGIDDLKIDGYDCPSGLEGFEGLP